jgi:hypothetical protein
MSAPVVPNLHDATLIDLHFDWSLGECVLRFAGSPFGPKGPFSLCWSDVSDFRISHRLEWGPSVSVLEMTQSGADLWSIEMQSGDKIEIAGCLSVDR